MVLQLYAKHFEELLDLIFKYFKDALILQAVAPKLNYQKVPDLRLIYYAFKVL